MKYKEARLSLSIRYLMRMGLLLSIFSLPVFAVDTKPQPNAPIDNLGNVSTHFNDAIAAKSRLPVRRNRFVVDKGVQEIQVLVATDEFTSIALISPDGKTLNPYQNSANNLTWQKIDKLYAIKVPFPTAGQWQIQGNFISYPEVIVTSSLDIVTPEFPNNLIRGETLALSVYLQENGKKIIEGDLLTSTTMTATLQNTATAEIYKIYLTQDEQSKRKDSIGVFRYDYPLDNLPGVYRLDIKAVGLLFARERYQEFYLHDYPATTDTKIDAQNDEMIIKTQLNSPMLNVPSFKVSAFFQNTDGSSETLLMDKKDDNRWELVLPASGDIAKMSIILAGYLKDARQVQVVLPEVKIEQLYQQAYLELQQNQLLKSNQAWQRLQIKQIDKMLPFSRSKQIETYINDAQLISNPALRPLINYRTALQDLLEVWAPKLFVNQEEEWMHKQDKTEEKKAVLTKEQIKANLLAEQKAKAKAEAKKQAAIKLAKKKKMLLIGFGVVFVIFLCIIALVGIVLFKPFKRKQASEEKPARRKVAQEKAEEKPQAQVASEKATEQAVKAEETQDKADLPAPEEAPTELSQDKVQQASQSQGPSG